LNAMLLIIGCICLIAYKS